MKWYTKLGQFYVISQDVDRITLHVQDFFGIWNLLKDRAVSEYNPYRFKKLQTNLVLNDFDE